MTPLPRRQTLCRIVFSTVLLTAGSIALADSPNCDMRQLALSSSQQEQLRQVRAEYRQRMDNLVAQSRNLRQYTTQASNLVLSGPVFDENMARHYVNGKIHPANAARSGKPARPTRPAANPHAATAAGMASALPVSIKCPTRLKRLPEISGSLYCLADDAGEAT